MHYRKFGNSDFLVSAIGLGCWQFSGNHGMAGRFWGNMDENTIRSIVQSSLDSGVNWFDTAELYGKGYSERYLSRALQSLSIDEQSSFIATKWNPVLRFAGSIGRTFIDRETNLAPYPIRVLQVHNPASLSSIQKQMQAMAALVHAGKIEMVGVSNFSLRQMQIANETLKAEGLALASNQMRYHMLDRSIEKNGVLDYARQYGITIIAYSPLAQGILTGRYHEQPDLIRKRPGFRKYLPAFGKRSLQRTQQLIDTLREIASEYEVTPAQVALRWVIQAQGETIIAIPGASSAHQAQQNAAVMKMELSSAEIHLLDKISREVNIVS